MRIYSVDYIRGVVFGGPKENGHFYEVFIGFFAGFLVLDFLLLCLITLRLVAFWGSSESLTERVSIRNVRRLIL